MEQGRLDAVVRPIDRWPGKTTENRRWAQFSAPESATWELLKRELRMLGAKNIVIQLALREDQIRLDGWPKANSNPAHPGIILAFDSKYGPLKYATDTFYHFKENLRALALGLEALRRVDRYGITKRGEQYAGWKALTAGPSREGDADRGRDLIERFGSVTRALKATHPDQGGKRDDYEAVQAARAEGASDG
jgi:hypothetical protein